MYLRLTQSTYMGTDETLTIHPIGDFQVGHVNYREDVVKERLSKLNYSNRALLMGDLAECATKRSIGKGVFDTNMTPRKQREYLIELLRPYKDYIDGAVTGNHEERIANDTSIDITEDICKELGIPYHHYRGLVKYAWNGVAYTFEIWHGVGHGVSIQAAFKQCEDMANKVFADVYCMGHVHKIATSDRVFYAPDTRNNKIIRVKQRFVLTGSAMASDDGYAEMSDLQERDLGFPTIYLRGVKGQKHIEIKT